MSDNSREEQFDVEKLMHFANGVCIILMKNHTVPQRWILLWTESNGDFGGKRKGYSELVLRCTYREICQKLAAPEDAKIEAEVEAELLNANIDVDRTVALLKRRTRLLAMNDKLMDELEARDEALLARIQRLPKAEQEGFVRDAIAEYKRLDAEDASGEDHSE